MTTQISEALRSVETLADFMEGNSRTQAMQRAGVLWPAIHRLIYLAETLVDNDPDDPVADIGYGLTLLDSWRMDAEATLAHVRGSQSAFHLANKTAAPLLRIAMRKHNILREALIDRVVAGENIPRLIAKMLVDCFVDGGPCAVVVGAALISAIVDAGRMGAPR